MHQFADILSTLHNWRLPKQRFLVSYPGKISKSVWCLVDSIDVISEVLETFKAQSGPHCLHYNLSCNEWMDQNFNIIWLNLTTFYLCITCAEEINRFWYENIFIYLAPHLIQFNRGFVKFHIKDRDSLFHFQLWYANKFYHEKTWIIQISNSNYSM